MVKDKTSGLRNVLMLSTSTTPPWSNEIRRSQNLHKLYDFTKGGADIVDQILLFKNKDPKVDNGNFVLPAGYLWSQIQHCLLLEPEEGPKEGKLL